ncbi:MAG: 50S ribosomal protein L18 [Parcubacteria group bacterium RIFCSPLOWO2_01_FULL_40_65]|nr:ribosomal protein L18 [uncultured bacterium]OHB17686.1 MAG: 50S ribosomal protein L18 [Parcubacteria group bacterium RIFCSPHIGHO2_01_FULL_40_30]OHB19864.1 MAG: 50S ribosomal protein L18 [Parcubacteria group bacterium RIFCSPHIGHO2_02_FULL_40_12]OHB21575.1 MAG: 50S ribosomal protein L18 [Parcubacteria group bacterium RIFCSPLOWO2_01_FULL_40_65]OHB23499.1 MAG: 50S ribosomal protein L18 [Parcubacteria group bacterium RIFCSPLOWO2_02_FULL_40_12]OHB24026.1 MAG: 50S ribosomal protein L18 [Parcubacte
MKINRKEKRKIRHKRVRAIVSGTAEKPRLSVFRSSIHIYAQLIDDMKGITLFSASDAKETKAESLSRAKIASAFKVGEVLAKKAVEKGINKVVFDRGGYKYHGRIKALADGARNGGLKF